ncbi:LysO family transporter [Caloranaerobacter sp. TR13]|uniref:LysO family transporter n=1 Tax=Caloranaerobacter sp. TR13 TaxID=1302151 RepID=UPI0006D427E7|nr:LysO family transporter [Caloranaerobacter sp. TR13]
MLSRFILYLVLLFIGFIIGARGIISSKNKVFIQKLQYLSLFLLLLFMGIRIGMDEKVLNNLFSLGIKAFILSLLSVIFSIIFVKLVKRFIYNSISKGESESEL